MKGIMLPKESPRVYLKRYILGLFELQGIYIEFKPVENLCIIVL